jgi:hypothetical protein
MTNEIVDNKQLTVYFFFLMCEAGDAADVMMALMYFVD